MTNLQNGDGLFHRLFGEFVVYNRTLPLCHTDMIDMLCRTG
jgi:hypothetical protein